MSKPLPVPKPTRSTYLARRALQIAVSINTKWPDYIPRVEVTRLTVADGINISMFRMARRVVKLAAQQNRQDIVDQVLADEISLHRAEETLLKGDRVQCPTCKGAGHIFRRDLNRKTRNEDPDE